MSFFSLLRKPGWEHRDPVRRAAAVANETNPILISKLADFARNDVDASVRLAALRRIDDLSLLGDRMRHDADAGIRSAARQRFLQRLLDPSIPMADRERLIAVEEDSEILATIAQQAPEASLRKLALERVARPGLISERCVKDPDPELRMWLLGRIEDIPTLERIADRSRKTDKVLSRTARERVQASRLAAGDPEVLMERALAICEALDQLRRTVAPNAETQRDALREEWNGLKSRLDATVERRVEGYFTALETALNPPEPQVEIPVVVEAPAVEVVENIIETPVPARSPDPAIEALVAELTARSARLGPRELDEIDRRWQQRLRQISPLLAEEEVHVQAYAEQFGKVKQRLDAREQERQIAMKAVAERVSALEAEVTAGHVAAAREIQRQLDADRKLLRDQFPKSLVARLGEASRELDTLANWQHWSNNKARLRVIEDVEALAGSGLHPDALAAKIKEYQAEWQQLNDSEGGAEHPLTRRFRGAAHRVLAPAKAYFEKRRELRGSQREEIEAIATDIAAKIDPNTPVRELIAARRNVIEQLRRCDDLDPAGRREVSRRLRELLARIDAAVTASENEALEQKRKLLSNLRRDLMHVELDAALPIARQAQTTWKTLPRAGRKVEDQLWAELREIVDPWFAQADSRQRERSQAESAITQEAQGILEELAGLAADTSLTVSQRDARLTALQTRWRELAASLPTDDATPAPTRERRGERTARSAPRSGLDERAFDRAVASVEAARDQQLVQARHNEVRVIAEAGKLLDQRDTLPVDDAARESLTAQVEALALPADARQGVAARMNADPSVSASEEADVRAQELTVLAELARGMESPEDARELRRRIQIERLSQHLSGGANDGDEFRPLLIQYISLHGVSVATRQALAARWEALTQA